MNSPTPPEALPAMPPELISALCHPAITKGDHDELVQIVKADRLSCFQAGAAAERAKSAWISVEERLPKPDEDVLIWSARRGGLEVAGYRPWDQDDHCWAIDGTFYPRSEATHWMPLPASPLAASGKEIP